MGPTGGGRVTEITAVSPWARAGLEHSPAFTRPPRFADCTLRDGEQQPGVVFTRAQKVEIARALAALGVHDLELGTPAVSSSDAEAIAEVVALDLGVYTSALARATPKDVDLVRSCGVDAVRLSMPISPRQRAAKIDIDDEEYLKRALEICVYAKEQGLDVIFSPYDTTRCELPLLNALLETFAREGCVDRVRLVDTTGAASPEAIRFLLAVMREAGGGIPIEVHCHDDFGLATANTVAAALDGAEHLSTTINGIGERSGNAPLEEVAAALALLYGVDTGLDLEALASVSELVARYSGVQLPPHKAVVGENAFSHESGLVVSGVVRDPFTAEAYAPELVGRHRRIVVGKKSGRASIEAKLNELLPDTADTIDVDAVLTDVKRLSIELERSLQDAELVAIATRHSKDTHGS